MSLLSLEEIEKAITNINSDLAVKCENMMFSEWFIVTLLVGPYRIIEFCGVHIWNDEYDERKILNEDTDEREELEPFLREQIALLITILQQAKKAL